MSTEQLPSDTKLAGLREEAAMAITTKRKPIVSGNELLALVECAEVLKEMIADVQMDDHIGTDRAIAALAKLDPT